MNIQTAAKYMELGYRIKRPHWLSFWLDQEKLRDFNFFVHELLADDWELIITGIATNFPITYSD